MRTSFKPPPFLPDAISGRVGTMPWDNCLVGICIVHSAQVALANGRHQPTTSQPSGVPLAPTQRRVDRPPAVHRPPLAFASPPPFKSRPLCAPPPAHVADLEPFSPIYYPNLRSTFHFCAHRPIIWSTSWRRTTVKTKFGSRGRTGRSDSQFGHSDAQCPSKRSANSAS